jgi:hypothetical protein
MANSLASINIRFAVDLKQFSTEMQNSLREIKKQGDSFKSLGSILSTFVTLPLLAAGGASLKFASDYEESLNKVDVAFKTSSVSVKNFAKDTLNSFGIAEGSALEMASLFGDMATAMNISESEAAKMSTSLVGLAGDLASFKNIGIDQASNALKSIFTGETESLKNLGIVMTEANLQQFALSQGYKGSIKNLTEASKVQLRYNFVLEKTKNAQGDFARTGGGAANQTRIFTESLKQIGQQLGSIILPFFTKVVTIVNEKIKAFSNLSSEAKTLIVVIAGITAAIGPLLSVIGNVLSFVPRLVASFVALKASFASLTAIIVANPLGALAVALGLVVSAFAIFNGETKKALKEQSLLNKVNSEAVDLYANQKVKVDELFKVAQNENASKKERLKAIKDLNKISPEYFGNLSLETINTDKAREAQEKYTVALLNGAKAKAAQNILTQLTEDKIKLDIENLKNQEALKKRQDELNKKQSDNIQLNNLYNSTNKKGAELQAVFKKASDDKFNSETSFLTQIIEKNKQYLGLLDQDIVSTNSLVSSKKDLAAAQKEVIVPGTIAYYENEISKLKDLQNEATLTSREYLLLGQQINEFQSKIDAISAPIEPIKITLDNEQFKAATIENTEYFKSQVDRIKEEGQRFLEDRDAENAALLERANQTKEAYGIIGQSFVDIFSSFSQGFVESLGIADSGMKSFVSGLVGTITKLIAMALSASMANSVQGATQSAVATGPGAVFAQPAFIATAIAGILSAFASIPKFETGGVVVPGTSLYGDKILARVNSGELILNQKQQSNLWGMINQSGSNVSIGLDGAFKLSGSDLELVIERAINKNNRKR